MQVSDTTVTRHRGYTQKLKRALALRVTWTSIPGRLSLRASRASTSHDTVNADISEISATSRHPHTPTDAHTFLSERDVTVTNQSDKDEQLPKIPRLDNRVQETFEVIELLKPREQAAAAESGRSQGSTKVQSLRSRLRLASRSTISSTVSCGSEVPPSADCAAATVAQQDQPTPRGRSKSQVKHISTRNEKAKGSADTPDKTIKTAVHFSLRRSSSARPSTASRISAKRMSLDETSAHATLQIDLHTAACVTDDAEAEIPGTYVPEAPDLRDSAAPAATASNTGSKRGSEPAPSADCVAAAMAQQDQPAPRGRLKSRIHILRVLNSLKHTVNDIGSRRRSSTTISLAGVSHHLSSSSSQRMTSSTTSCTASSTAVDAIPLSQVSSVGSPRSRRFDSERCTSSSSLVSTKI